MVVNLSPSINVTVFAATLLQTLQILSHEQ